MHRTCIAVIDATRARIFTFDRSAEADGVRERFAERTDLVNPARRLTPAELFSDSRPGTNRTGNLQYAFDDHRDAHMARYDAEFASSIAGAIGDAMRESKASRLIVCASPKMLGALRATGVGADGIPLRELAYDYVKLTPHEIRARLAEHGVLPAPPPRTV